MNEDTNPFDTILEKLWQKSNLKGYACPLYEVHKRAFLFANKDLWMSHLTEEHITKDWEFSHDIKSDIKTGLEIYKEVIAEMSKVEIEDDRQE